MATIHDPFFNKEPLTGEPNKLSRATGGLRASAKNEAKAILAAGESLDYSAPQAQNTYVPPSNRS